MVGAVVTPNWRRLSGATVFPYVFERTRSNTNRRIAEDRFAAWRDLSISVTVCAIDAPWACAISFSPLQNSSSRLMLVLCPSTATDRLVIDDFMASSFEHTC